MGSVEARLMLPRDVGSRLSIPMLIREPSTGRFIFVKGTSEDAYSGRIW